jgi:ABC-type amino acid transport substrate-binding protein
MRTLAGSALLVAAAWLSGTTALGCGDKLLALGRGLRFQRPYAAQQANLVIYSAGPQSSATLGNVKLQTTLRRAVRSLQLVQGGSQLDQALKSGKVDVLLVDFADLAGITSTLQSASWKPIILPVIVKPSKAGLAAALKEYKFALKAGAGDFEYLRVIDEAMKSR